MDRSVIPLVCCAGASVPRVKLEQAQKEVWPKLIEERSKKLAVWAKKQLNSFSIRSAVGPGTGNCLAVRSLALEL